VVDGVFYLFPARQVQPNSGFIDFLLHLEAQIFGGALSSPMDVSDMPFGISV